MMFIINSIKKFSILPDIENKWKETYKALKDLIKQTTNTQPQDL